MTENHSTTEAIEVHTSDSQKNADLINYVLHLADTNLILTQRNAEWCGHGPILEQDIAITNITLDLIGQSRYLYQYAAVLINGNNPESGNGADEDNLAFMRKEREFKNLLLVEQPNEDWAQTILRQFLYSSFQFLLYETLQKGSDVQLAAIAEKAIKETSYHVTWSSEWVLRLGDGTAESRDRMVKAIQSLWRYTGEMFIPAGYESALNALGVIPDVSELRDKWLEKVSDIFTEATLEISGNVFMQTGGKTGTHTEPFGFMITEMQYLQRTYPNASW